MIDQISARRRVVIVVLFSVVALLVFTGCCYLGQDWFLKWHGIPTGGVLMLLAIPLHLLGEKSAISYVFSFLLNTAGMGFCASAYYTMTIAPSALEDLLPALVLPLAILLVTCILLVVCIEKKQPIVTIVIFLEIALIIASIVFWVDRGAEFYAFSLFSLVVASFYTVVYHFAIDEDEYSILRDVSLGSYGAFLLVGVAALVAIACVAGDGCDCDGGDCCDCDCSGCDCGSGDGKTKAKKIKNK